MEESVARLTREFFSHYPLRRFKKGQVLVYGGDEPGSVFYIVEGTVRQYDISDRGVEIVVNVFKPLSFFPMSWAINRRHNPYFFEANSDVELRIVPADDVVSFLKTHPDVMFDLLSRLYSGADGLQRRMAHLMGGSAQTRLVFELITECKRFGTYLENGEISISINESSLAERTGLSRETISREMSRLRHQSLLSRQGKFIIVPRLEALESLLGDRL